MSKNTITVNRNLSPLKERKLLKCFPVLMVSIFHVFPLQLVDFIHNTRFSTFAFLFESVVLFPSSLLCPPFSEPSELLFFTNLLPSVLLLLSPQQDFSIF